MRVRSPHVHSESDLRLVIDEMRRLGPPTIRALLYRGELHAIEGSHRLEAAKRLKLRPVIVVIADETTDRGLIVDGVAHGPKTQTVRELFETYVHQAGPIRPVHLF